MNPQDAFASLSRQQEQNAIEYARMADDDANAGRLERMQMYLKKSEASRKSAQFNAFQASIYHSTNRSDHHGA